MIRALKKCVVALGLAGVSLACVAASPPAADAGTIYKHVDEQGRVTYANSPIKGGVRVELEPLTVIPATPTGSLTAQSAAAPYARAPLAAAAVAPVSNPSNIIIPVAPVATIAAAAPVATAAVAAAERTVVAVAAETAVPTPEAMNKLTQQRRAETRKRLLEGELQAEEESLAAARAKLNEEQGNSGNFRLIRASFAATQEAVTVQKPLITPETRAEIERHFERIRNLQDQVAMHEAHLRELRTQLASLK